jgi:pimeloyl-ACP methyl ester carboxylesterase
MAKNSIYKSESGKRSVINFYETLLNDWCKPLVEHVVSTSYGNTFVLESGNKTAPVIVLLHGSGSNSAMWIGDAMVYSKNHHVFTIDIIGECGKSSESRPDFKSHHYSNWLNELFESLNIHEAILIGCSLGGWIAIDFTVRYPDKIRKLVLMATAGITQVRIRTILWILVTSLFGKWGFNKLNKMVYGNQKIDNTALEFTLLVKEHFTPRTDVLPVFTDENLKIIQAQVLFIGGETDCFYNSAKTAKRLSRFVKNFKYEILADTGHVLVNQTHRILKFISE